MLHRTILKVAVSMLLLLSGLACTMATMATTTEATGDAHQRHASGMDSQVHDM